MDDREFMTRETDARRIIETLNEAEVFHMRLYEDPVEHKCYVLLSYRAKVRGLRYTNELTLSRQDIIGAFRMLKSPGYKDYKNARTQLGAISSAYRAGRMGRMVRGVKRGVKKSLGRILNP